MRFCALHLPDLLFVYLCLDLSAAESVFICCSSFTSVQTSLLNLYMSVALRLPPFGSLCCFPSDFGVLLSNSQCSIASLREDYERCKESHDEDPCDDYDYEACDLTTYQMAFYGDKGSETVTMFPEYGIFISSTVVESDGLNHWTTQLDQKQLTKRITIFWQHSTDIAKETIMAVLIYAVDAVVEVAEANNSYTLPSFHYLRQHDIVERSSYPSKVQSTFNHIQVTSPSYALVEVAEANNCRTLPSFHYPRQHDIFEISSQPSKLQSTFNPNPGQVSSPSYLGYNNNLIKVHPPIIIPQVT
ncbi:hypothetical protein Tco_1430588 [Tanacetum coccineum]